uniref:Uncharacterized protein n=1 Tax=Opuntia streptacantha TaxID=393608 RepID=A0A7C9AVH2_OPUST
MVSLSEGRLTLMHMTVMRNSPLVLMSFLEGSLQLKEIRLLVGARTNKRSRNRSQDYWMEVGNILWFMKTMKETECLLGMSHGPCFCPLSRGYECSRALTFPHLTVVEARKARCRWRVHQNEEESIGGAYIRLIDLCLFALSLTIPPPLFRAHES